MCLHGVLSRFSGSLFLIFSKTVFKIETFSWLMTVNVPLLFPVYMQPCPTPKPVSADEICSVTPAPLPNCSPVAPPAHTSPQLFSNFCITTFFELFFSAAVREKRAAC